MKLAEIFKELEAENAASILKHGLWRDNYTDSEQKDAIEGEFCEWYTAHLDGNIHGEHGELAELLDLANVCIRRYMFLTGEKLA